MKREKNERGSRSNLSTSTTIASLAKKKKKKTRVRALFFSLLCGGVPLCSPFCDRSFLLFCSLISIITFDVRLFGVEKRKRKRVDLNLDDHCLAKRSRLLLSFPLILLLSSQLARAIAKEKQKSSKSSRMEMTRLESRKRGRDLGMD